MRPLAFRPMRAPGSAVLVIGEPCIGDDVIRRVAVKGIAVARGRVLMLRPSGRDDLKFPGGGLAPGEDDATALTRELVEECGHELVRITGHAVDTLERRPANDRAGAVFEMSSRYYWCDVHDARLPRSLDDYERDLVLEPEWLPIDEARRVCARAATGRDALPWAARELAVVEWLRSRTGTV